MSSESLRIAVVGAGPVGSVQAALLARLPGIHVTIFERREDDAENATSAVFGNAANALKRSINLALSHRGIIALDELDLTEDVMKMAIRMPKRVIHDSNDNITLQQYGKGSETLWSVSRADLNKFLVRSIAKTSNIEVRIGHALLTATEGGLCRFKGPKGEYEEQFDFIIGADGAYSRVRETMLRLGRVSFNRLFIRHGYKEFTIPPVKDANGNDQFALKEPEGIHIWPKGDLMLIALPNPDKTYTATLFAPYTSVFNVVDKDSDESIRSFFQRVFPEALKYLPHLIENFRENPTGPLMTLRCDPWKLGRFLLVGDAAHAVVPFYGQGMNAGFEDALQLYLALKDKFPTCQTKEQRRAMFDSTAEAYSVRRKKAVDVLSDLCLEHYHDMASNTASWWYLFQRRLQNAILPSSVMNLYRYVAFSHVPYDEALQLSRRTESLFQLGLYSTIALTAGAIGTCAFVAYQKFAKK